MSNRRPTVASGIPNPYQGCGGVQGSNPNLQLAAGGVEGAERHPSEKLPGGGVLPRGAPPRSGERVLAVCVHSHYGATGEPCQFACGYLVRWQRRARGQHIRAISNRCAPFTSACRYEEYSFALMCVCVWLDFPYDIVLRGQRKGSNLA